MKKMISGLKRYIMLSENGEITVFLSLILTCICALMCGLLESARVAGSGWYLQMAADSSMDSLMSKYHRDVWEKYHLLLLEFEDTEGLEAELEEYLLAYLDGESAYYLEDHVIQADDPVRITDQSGEYLEREILDYMKLGIWTMEQEPDKLKKLGEEIKEADSLGEITAAYKTDTGGVMKLERALENIADSLRRQEEYLESGKKKLKNCDGNGFIKAAEKLKKELKKMPALIEKYEKEADDLAEKLAQSEIRAQEKKDDLKPDTWQMVTDEISGCHAYTDREGERRKEVAQTGRWAEDNLAIVEAAIREAEETQDYIDSWESDDDDDELDEEPLWRDVLSTVSRFKTDHSFEVPAVKDKKKMSLLENAAHLAEGDLLTIVVPEDKEVSKAAVEQAQFPSKTAAQGAPAGGTGIKDLLGAAFINEYAAYHFTNFCSAQEDEAEKTLRYEQEYILNGKSSDRENLRTMVNRIVKVREAMNLIYLYRDSEKRNEAKALAAAITGAAGISPLTDVVSFFIMTVWAFAESLEDMKTLLSGGKVPFLKSGGEWRLSLEQMLNPDGLGRNRTLVGGGKTSAGGGKTSAGGGGADGTSGGSGRGMDYQAYLKLFFMMQNRVEKDYRMMDMIQENITQKQKDFLMVQCAYKVKAEYRAKGRYARLKRTAEKAY